MAPLRTIALALALTLLSGALPASAGSPPRPTEGHGSNFHLLVGAEGTDLDLDPRGSVEFVAAGLDPRVKEGGLVIGVGWVFRSPLRLGLTAGAWRAEVDREGVDCMLARAAAELHLSVVETGAASLEATASAAFLILDYQGLVDEVHMPGSSVGLGATGRLRLLGPLGLGLAYQYQLGRFQPTTIEVEGQDPFRVQPTARLHGLRLTVFIDL